MALISVAEAQQWVKTDKLTISALDAQLEATVSEYVLSRLAGAYTVTGWTSDSNTPKLVRKVISMLYTSWEYARTYAEMTAEDENRYAFRLRQWAEDILTGILDGSSDLLDVADVSDVAEGPLYWPDDTTGTTQQYDAAGSPLGGQYSEDRKFTMGTVF